MSDDDDSSKVILSNNTGSKSTTDTKKVKEQSLPKAGEKAKDLSIMLGIMLLISVSIFAVLRTKKLNNVKEKSLSFDRLFSFHQN